MSSDWDTRYGERPKSQQEEDTSRVPGWDRLKEFATSVVEGQPLLGEEDPELEAAKFWLPMLKKNKAEPQGKLLLSVQLVPLEDVERLPAGSGRKEPNQNPTLPPPVGRLKFSVNPLKMLYSLIGPKYWSRMVRCFCCAFCIVVLVLLIYYVVPVVLGNGFSDVVFGG